jgi:hypothetical protein
MHKPLLVALLAAACLVGCTKSSSSSPSASAHPDDAVQLKLKELSGTGATDCGRLDIKAANETLTGASTCATKSAQDKHPFYVAYDMPGMTTGVAGNAQGKFFAVELQGASTGAQLSSGPCPAEMRVAKSGRVTCFVPGTMGLTPTAADPHSGISMTPGGAPAQGGFLPQPFPGSSGASQPQKPPVKKQ